MNLDPRRACEPSQSKRWFGVISIVSYEVHQRAMRSAVQKTGIVKPATVRTLRHSFATNMLTRRSGLQVGRHDSSNGSNDRPNPGDPVVA
jgi:hypothetical protein